VEECGGVYRRDLLAMVERSRLMPLPPPQAHSSGTSLLDQGGAATDGRREQDGKEAGSKRKNRERGKRMLDAHFRWIYLIAQLMKSLKDE
jgi:hypothetical protein